MIRKKNLILLFIFFPFILSNDDNIFRWFRENGGYVSSSIGIEFFEGYGKGIVRIKLKLLRFIHKQKKKKRVQ